MSRKKKKHVKAPDFLQNLSTPPNGALAQRVLYHGSRITLMVLLAAAIGLLFLGELSRSTQLYEEGDVAEGDVAAEVDFQVPVDSADLELRRAEAAAAVPPVFLYQADAQDRVVAGLNGFFDQIQAAVEAGGRPAVEVALRAEGLSALVGSAESFLNPIELQALRQATLSAVRALLDQGLYSDQGEEARAAGRIRVLGPSGEGFRDVDDLLWGTDLWNAAVDALPPSTAEFENSVQLLFIHFFESPYSLDPVRSEVEKAEARSAVPTTEGNPVVEGEFIVREGAQVGPEQIKRLEAHQIALQSRGLIQELGRAWDWGSMLGNFLLNLLILGIFAALLFFYRPEVYGTFRWLLLLGFLILGYFLVAAGISWQGYRWELLPIAFVVLPVAILWDGRMALILALVMGVLSAVQTPFNTFPVLVFTIIGGAVAALSARAVRRRSQTWIFIALITLGYALALAAMGLAWKTQPASAVAVSILFAGGNAILSSIVALGFMPVFEWFTGVTTDQTLLEWADPNRPLLKSLSLEASGTYAHTINVANLAEAAAGAIGANGLLARVGVYYHDVGKMLKPQYFVENQPGERNPHDQLKPHTSATLVREHVVEGERLARDEGVPDVVARFIPEHHGTQLIGFFYEKAKEESDEEPDPEEFRYPGPKPQTKETAIAMLADSVESATRALHDSSPERIEELISTIVDGKIRDGQLSDSPLTFREISVIQEQFVKVVSGMFHHRLDYPATRHITEASKDDSPTEPPASEGDYPQATSQDEPAKPEGKAGPDEAPMDEQLPLTPPDDPPPPERDDG